MENQKSNKGLIALVVFLLLLVCGLGGYIYYDKILNKETKEPKKSEKKEVKEKKEEKKLGTFDLSKFDGSRAINGESHINYLSPHEPDNYITKMTANGGDIEIIKAELQSDKKNVSANINWGELSYNKESKNYTYTISNFNSNIRKVYIASWSQGTGTETIIYLMEDGTVEYTPITYKIVTQSVDSPNTVNLKSYGKIQDVKDVVMIAGTSTEVINAPAGGNRALIGIKEDGSFYDISKILDQTSEYQQ